MSLNTSESPSKNTLFGRQDEGNKGPDFFP